METITILLFGANNKGMYTHICTFVMCSYLCIFFFCYARVKYQLKDTEQVLLTETMKQIQMSNTNLLE